MGSSTESGGKQRCSTDCHCSMAFPRSANATAGLDLEKVMKEHLMT